MKKAFIPIITLIMAIAVFSCNDDPYKSVDPSKIIGQKMISNNLPYQTEKGYGSEDYKYTDGKHYGCIATRYKNNIIAYLYGEDEIITDYFFSKAIRYKKAERIPKGTSYEEVKKILGEPVFLIYPGIKYKDYESAKDYGNSFYCLYFYKEFDKFSLRYDLTTYMIGLNFDNDGKLKKEEHELEYKRRSKYNGR